ncbi:tRNA (adenosine(37)-N6)-dimethylallyltransferase MiaA [Paracoccus sp. (in: a-proteobacteria)]|uniref:tRNA (adenosine(37)-N6)-dimethylallyltransferase MiaA n=1 Tax=Paracoccus sp. TaxID=267 RepID=UPI0028A14DA4|nr:tRNA (adenosine(37)-N6)-dimethylallyltransferase MiaA [Paracoccus sp. (in: a-proteobacteria)]
MGATLPQGLDPERHIVIAGPTASGKSALALAIAEAQGGTIVNADALQIWSCWRVLTARPSPKDEARAPHRLYGHVDPGQSYSVGDWLTAVRALAQPDAQPGSNGRLIITGGTGLYMSALTRGLAVIPPVPAEIRAQGDAMLAAGGLQQMIAALDADTHARIDLKNPARVQRAWEVLTATGRGITSWQAETPPPFISPDQGQLLVIDADRDRLATRIATRFSLMMDEGALDEVHALLPQWDGAAQWAKAIGAPELVAHLRGELTLDQAIELAVISTRQYAKSQRIWFRGRMRDWRHINAGI